VQVVEAPERGKRHLLKTGRIEKLQGPGYAMVVFDIGGFGYFREHQLEVERRTNEDLN
jgi:hypothetical protein